ncbi:Eef1g [Symbiodinium sp. CCMP2592]|nr:Eef1g [Symbiodinium sp. CCMP2592]
MALGTLWYVKEAVYKAEKALVAAKFTGASLEKKEFDPAKDAKKPDFLSKNPSGKVPYLETPFGVLFSSNSIARYVAKAREDSALYGDSFDEEGQIDTWMEFGMHDVEIPLFTWAYPVMGLMEDSPNATKDAQADVKKALQVLEESLKKSSFLVGTSVTLADICIVCALKEGFKYVLDPATTKPFPKTCEWFDRCCAMPQFKSIFGEVKKCQKSGSPTKVLPSFAPPARDAKAAKAEPKAKSEPKAKAEPKAAAVMSAQDATAGQVNGAAPAVPKLVPMEEPPRGSGEGPRERAPADDTMAAGTVPLPVASHTDQMNAEVGNAQPSARPEQSVNPTEEVHQQGADGGIGGVAGLQTGTQIGPQWAASTVTQPQPTEEQPGHLDADFQRDDVDGGGFQTPRLGDQAWRVVQAATDSTGVAAESDSFVELAEDCYEDQEVILISEGQVSVLEFGILGKKFKYLFKGVILGVRCGKGSLESWEGTDGDDEVPETVKTSMMSLPELAAPEGEMSGLKFQDWMVQVTTAMQDLSIGKVVGDREEGGDGAVDMAAGKWVRVNARCLRCINQEEPGTQMMRSSLRIDARPSLEDIMKYHQHLQAEVENIVASRPVSSDGLEGVDVEPSVPLYIPLKGVNKVHLEPEGEVSPVAAADGVLHGQSVLSWGALLQAAAKVAAASPVEPKAPTMKVLSLSPPRAEAVDGSHVFALVDSGATHPLRRARTEEEWRAGDRVTVNLAGGETVELRMNEAGTLLVPCAGAPRSSSSAPIVPLGSLVGMLGYRLEWSGSRCMLTSREGDVLKLRVRDGCPEITESQALDLIAKIEEKKLASLRTATGETRARVREAAISMQKTWFDHLLSYCDSGLGSDAVKAIREAPFFEGVPPEALYGLAEAVPCSNGWDALKGLKHLNRRTRRRLWSSNQWVLHLYAGKTVNQEILFLERQGFTVLELDLERGKSHDVWDPLVWRALEWGARSGKIASIIGGPSQGTFMLKRSMTPGPEALRSNDFVYGGWPGQSEKDKNLVNRHTGMYAKMLYLHSLATAGRCKWPAEPSDVKEVGLMIEQPSDPRSYLNYNHPLAQDSVSFWRTPMWEVYAEEAGLATYSFDMSSLGKALERHTTIGTNLPLRHLDGLKGRVQDDPFPPERASPSVWSREFSEVVAIAVRSQRLAPRMLRMSTEQWKEHVRKGHLPYRADCTTCVTAGATGRRHARVEHPSCFVMSADVSGPLKVPGIDADARGAFPRPHKYMFIAKVRIPKTFVDDGRGVGLDYDPGEIQEDLPPGEDAFDYEGPSEREGAPPPDGDGEGIQEEDVEESDEPGEGRKRRGDDDVDVAAPELVNLIFASGLQDNKGSTVLEAVQDVVLYCAALNIPIVRFHCDRGMEFYAKSTRQWIKNQGIRFTTSEGGLHQQNGAVENAVKYVKQRARTLLIGAKLPQKLWPQAVAMATASQRATVLGMETKLVAPFGTKVLVRRREYGGSAEPGKPDDLSPRWIEGSYVGLSDTLRRGHVVYVSNEDGEKFIHTVHVRAHVVDPGLPEGEVEADLPGPPSKRVLEKARGSGDVVSISKSNPVFGDENLKNEINRVLEHWDEEEAHNLAVQVALSLGEGDRKFGVFRHGGSVGLTKVTYDKPWGAELLVRLMRERSPEAEFSALYVSVNTTKEVHIDVNNLVGKNNFVYPLVLPRRGGDLWIELGDGDVVRGKVIEMIDHKGSPRYGCVQPLTERKPFAFNPHRRHAVIPWKGLRVVLIGYTPGVPQNLKGPERQVLAALGFPVPADLYDQEPTVAVRVLSATKIDKEKVIESEEENGESSGNLEEIPTSSGEPLFVPGSNLPPGLPQGDDGGPQQVEQEEWSLWDMFIPLGDGDPESVPKAMIASCDGHPQLCKNEVVYTKNIESLLSSLTGPLDIVHTVDPAEALECIEHWLPAIGKEMGSFEPAVLKRKMSDPAVQKDLRTGAARLVPMKIVYTAKPPTEVEIESQEWFRRKARIVACGNMMQESGQETFAPTAPAEVVRSSLAISSQEGWDAAILDITSAFLLTPISAERCGYRVIGQPPRALVRAGLCEPDELWEFTRAVYGLRESPKWWGDYRDEQVARLVIELDGQRIELMRCRVEASWWKVVQGATLIGLLVIYVDDILICALPPVIKAVAKAIQALWRTSALEFASEGRIRFLGIEIEKIPDGFALSQQSYIAELVRTHGVKETQRDLIPVSRDLARFESSPDEAVFSTEDLREAQRYAGEILWMAQRTRPDISYTASLVASLSSRAPRRASMITRKAIGFLQRTAEYQLVIQSEGSQLTSWSDASYAPEGTRSHTGILIELGSAPLAWKSSRQSLVTLSTAEAELVSVTEGALIMTNIAAMIEELGWKKLIKLLKTDSTAALAIQKGSGSQRTRHLRIRSSWVAERIDEGDFEAEHCAGEGQLADALTKPLSSSRLAQLSKLIGLWNREELRGYVAQSAASELRTCPEQKVQQVMEIELKLPGEYQALRLGVRTEVRVPEQVHIEGTPKVREKAESMRFCEEAEGHSTIVLVKSGECNRALSARLRKGKAEKAEKKEKAEPKAKSEPKAKAEPKKEAAPAAPAAGAMANGGGDVEQQILAVGNEIREKKAALKASGLSGKKINEDPEVKALVERLQALKAGS